jgi:hypothetical protein
VVFGAGRSDEGVVDEHAQAVEYRVVVADVDRLAAFVVADAAEVSAELAQSRNAVASREGGDVLADLGVEREPALLSEAGDRRRRERLRQAADAELRRARDRSAVGDVSEAAALRPDQFAVGGNRDRHPGRGEGALHPWHQRPHRGDLTPVRGRCQPDPTAAGLDPGGRPAAERMQG